MRLTLTQQVALQGEAKIRGTDPFIGDALPNSAVDFTMPRLVDGQAATVDCCIATITVRAYDCCIATEQIDQFRDFVLKAVQDRLDAMTMQEFAALGLLLK